MIGFSTIEKYFLDILFPVTCLLCREGGEWICPGCLDKIKLLVNQVCPYCENNVTGSGTICRPCKEKFLSKNAAIPLDNLITSATYRGKNISHLIHTYKYDFVRDMSIPLGQILVKSILKNNLPLPDLIIPIPLHPRRQRWRGFNQSELLADYISEHLTAGFPIPALKNFIVRTRYTKPQMKIKSYQARKENIKNIFNISGDKSARSIIKNKTILLVDDIATTGATLFECGKMLKKHDARSVMGIVIARQEISTPKSALTF